MRGAHTGGQFRGEWDFFSKSCENVKKSASHGTSDMPKGWIFFVNERQLFRRKTACFASVLLFSMTFQKDLYYAVLESVNRKCQQIF